MKKCLLLVGLSMAACSPSPAEIEPAQSIAPSVSLERRDELKTVFGKAFATALGDSPSLRKLIKDEALVKFNNDYDVLYHLVKDRPLSDGQTVRELLVGYFESEEQLSSVERELPLLTIFVPELPMNSFSAMSWDTDTQIPSVGITSTRTNDVTLVNHKGEERTLAADLIPGFPVVVIKENERVVPVGNNAPSAMARGRVLKASGNLSFAFLADCFDGSRATDKSAMRGIKMPDSKLVDAYNIYQGTDGWHRDYIYYNISPTQTRGAISLAYKEHIRSFQLVGSDPAAAYSNIADQTSDDPKLKSSTTDTNSGWTGGSFEFKVRVLINAKNGLGQEFITHFLAQPDELFEVTYDYFAFGIYKPRITGFKTKGLALELINWDLNEYASTIKVEVEEVDITETHIETEQRTVKFATNFGIDFATGTLQKIGLKFGASLEETRVESNQRTYTLGNDILGSVTVHFGDNVLTNVTTTTFLGKPLVTATSREYSSGMYSISMEPTRVQ